MKNKIIIALLFITLSMTPKVKAIDWDKALSAVALTFVIGKTIEHITKSYVYFSNFSGKHNRGQQVECVNYIAPRLIADYCAYKFFIASFR